MAMDPNTTAAAAALLGAAHYYPSAAAAAAAVTNAAGTASMAQQYYAQNLASFANVAAGFMPMYGFPMFGAAPAWNVAPATIPPPASSLYDMDTATLQQQIAAQFTQATPEQQSVYYENVRQQLDTAASGLNDTQKQSLLRRDPSLIFSMKPLELEPAGDDDASAVPPPATPTCTRVIAPGKRARTSTPSSSKKPRKSKMPAAALGGTDLDPVLLNEDSPGSGSSQATTPRATPRGRPPGTSARAAAAAAGIELTPSGKKKSMTPQAEEMRARKAKMTWPKGTFLIRLQDVKVRSGRDHIWLVDNHQLLQRYNNESGSVRVDGSRVYHKTDRYTGWLCHEGFHYFPLYDQRHVLRQDADTATVLFPTEEELQQAIQYEEQEKARRAAAKESDQIIRPLPPSIRNKPSQYAAQLLEEQEQQAAAAAAAAESPTTQPSMVRAKAEERRAGGMMVKMEGRSEQVSASSSMTDLKQPSTSRAYGSSRHEMPSLHRQDYWAAEEEEDTWQPQGKCREGGASGSRIQPMDDLLAEDIMDERVCKQEVVDGGFGDLTDLSYSRLQ